MDTETKRNVSAAGTVAIAIVLVVIAIVLLIP